MGLLNQNTKSLAGNMQFLSNAFRSWLGFLGVRELARVSDEMQNLFNRLKLVTGTIEGATEAMKGLVEVADRTNQSITDVGTVYSRFAIALKNAGANTQELLSLTETLVNSFRISGSNASETANAMVQLSQAFSVGVLRGQDLRSVLEQNATISTLLKQRFGADLFKKAEEGAISITEVLKILSKSQQQINSDAQKLAPTFEQTLTKSMNKVSVAMGELNQNFQLSAKFATAMGFAMSHLAEILTVLAGVLTIVAVSRIPAMIDGLNKLRLAFLGFSAANPLLLALTTVATLGALIVENWDKVSSTLTRARASFLDFAADVEEKGIGIRQKLADATGSTILQDQIDRSKKSIESLRSTAQGLRDSLSIAGGKGKDPLADTGKNLDSLTGKLEKMPGPTKKIKDILGELNAKLLAGKITLEAYNKKLLDFDLYKLNRQFKEGKYDVLKYNEGLYNLDLQRLNRGLAKGTVSIREFNVEIASSKIAVLNEQLALGVIGLAEYNTELTKLEDKVRPGSAFYSGVASFIESVGTISQGIAKVTSQAFDHLAETLTNFIKTGKFQFADFTRAILDDITAMVVRAAIIRPIASGILGLIGAGTTGAVGAGGGGTGGGFSIASPGEFTFAKGGIMSSYGSVPLQKYASGGIANSPQMALFGEGRKPEAYVPLPDGRSIPVSMNGGSGGGVNFSQTIIINSDGSSTTSEKSTGDNAKQFANVMKQVAVDTIIQHKRPGGLLA